MSNPVGRPMKYRRLIETLDSSELFAPSTIVDHALDSGILDPERPEEDLWAERVRIRHTLSRFTANHNFPEEGDGLVKKKGQSPICAWYGWRWKDALPPKFIPKAKPSKRIRRSREETQLRQRED